MCIFYNKLSEIKIYFSASCPFQLPCLHFGYTDPKNCSKCRCPDGLTGLLCSKVARTKTLCGDQLIFESEEEYKKLQFKGVGECNYLIKVKVCTIFTNRAPRVLFSNI